MPATVISGLTGNIDPVPSNPECLDGLIIGRHALLRSDFFGSIVLGQVYFAHTRNSSTAFVPS